MFTNSFPALATAITLGGIFTWVSVLLGWVPQTLRDQAMAAFQSKVLERSHTWKAVTALTAAGLVPVLFLGSLSVTVSNEADCELSCRVTVMPHPAKDDQPVEGIRSRFVKAGVSEKWNLPTTLSGRKFLVYTSAKPPRIAEIYPLAPKALDLSSDFIRPGIVRAHLDTQNIRLERLSAIIHTERSGERQIAYEGETIWIGKGLPDASLPGEFVSIPLSLQNGECLRLEIRGPNGPIARAAERIEIRNGSNGLVHLDLVNPAYLIYEGEECP